MKWMFVLGLVVVAGLSLRLASQDRNDAEERDGGMAAGSTSGAPQHDKPSIAGAVGTSGSHAAHEGAAENQGGSVVTEIETITGTHDGMMLIGRRVDLHVEVQALANDRAFWVGSPDNRVLVVLGRDTRSGVERQHGLSSDHNILAVRGGQRAAISGVVRPVPAPDERHNWDLTEAGERELADRKIYIRADTVSSEGHGSF